MPLKIKSILSNHKWAIILAFIAAVIIAFPQAYFFYDHPDIYQGIGIMGAGDDEMSWLTRMREAQDGHPALSCVYLKDGKDEPYLVQPLGTIITASPGKIFSLGINNTLLLSRFFFSFVVFLVIYAFVVLFSKRKLVALAATTALVLGRDILSRGGIQDLIDAGTPTVKYLNLMRPVNPLMTYFFFFGFLLFFWLFFDASTRLSARKRWLYGVLSVLFLGLSFYDYFFTWTFLYAFSGGLILIFLLQKKWQQVKKISLVLSGAAALAIPYFINMYQVAVHPNYAEASQRFGLMGGHAPTLGLLAPLLFVFVLLFFPRQGKDRYFFALALAVTPLIVLNQQVIIGKTLSNVHYHWYYTWPLAIIFLVTITLLWLSQRKWRILKRVPAIFIILVSIASGVLAQGGSYVINEKETVEKQKYGEVMDWLNQNAQKEEIVFADKEISSLVVVFTPLNVFYHFKAQSCLSVSQERLLNSLFLYYRLDGVGKEEAEEFFFKNRGDLSHNMYSMYYYFLAGDYAGIPDEIILDWSQKYRDSFAFSTADFLNGLFLEYEVKYAVWDKIANPQWQLDQYPFLEKAAEFDDFVIYEHTN